MQSELSGIDEPYYCSQQIPIPPEFPDILKQFTKAAIRTQPKDVLNWSAAYFRALANGDIPPVKERVEMPMATQKTDTGLTPGLLKVLNTQLGTKKSVPLATVLERWEALSLPKERFDEIVRIGGLQGDVPWVHFLASAASTICDNIADTMECCCKILTHDPDGGPARISFVLFKDIYMYLVAVDGEIPKSVTDNALAYLAYYVEKQDGYVRPLNFHMADFPGLC